MAVSKEDRKDYEDGIEHSKMGIGERMWSDVLGNDRPLDNTAYWKGREGRELDDDKSDD